MRPSGSLAECAAVCFERAGHAALPVLQIAGKHQRHARLTGPPVAEQMRRAYADVPEATEYGATGVAVIVVEECERLTVYERSPKDGGGFDYCLIDWGGDEGAPGENFLAAAKARLEVSGILKGGLDDVRYRLNAKRKRAGVRSNVLPLLVVVVEFSSPVAHLEQL